MALLLKISGNPDSSEKKGPGLNAIINRATQLTLAFDNFRLRIEGSCEHVHEKKFIYDPTYLFSVDLNDDRMVLEKKVCSHCGNEELPPVGNPWQHCRKCWGKMVKDTSRKILWGQSVAVFVCECCKHEAYYYDHPRRD